VTCVSQNQLSRLTEADSANDSKVKALEAVLAAGAAHQAQSSGELQSAAVHQPVPRVRLPTPRGVTAVVMDITYAVVMDITYDDLKALQPAQLRQLNRQTVRETIAEIQMRHIHRRLTRSKCCSAQKNRT
jgi:hypothetical protein